MNFPLYAQRDILYDSGTIATELFIVQIVICSIEEGCRMGVRARDMAERAKERKRMGRDLPDDLEGFTEEEKRFLINSAERMPEKRSRIVSITTALARAAQGLSLAEKRILFCAIAKIQPYDMTPPPPGKEVLWRSVLHASEFAETFDVPVQNAYVQMRDASFNLLRRYVSFYELREFRRGSKAEKKPVPVRSGWVQDVTYLEDRGTIEIVWTRKIAGQLLFLKDLQYTKYRLQNASNLRSLYSWRLMEIFESYLNKNEDDPEKKGKGWFVWTVEEFAARMDVTEKQAANFGKIRTKAIEPAVKDLREKDGWIIEWKALKKGGRKYTHVRFDFRRDPQGRLF